MDSRQLSNAAFLKDVQWGLGLTGETACHIANLETWLMVKATLSKLVRRDSSKKLASKRESSGRGGCRGGRNANEGLFVDEWGWFGRMARWSRGGESSKWRLPVPSLVV
jgi:hypothetical protein